MPSHDELRQQNRQRRAALADERLESAARALTARILELPAYRDARRVAAYLAIKGEISLEAIIVHALNSGKQVFLPVIRGSQMLFAPYREGRPMRTSRFGLNEPEFAAGEAVDPATLDLVLAPLTVFDADCNRIGQGGGYYDRCFAFRRDPAVSAPLLIGVAHELQRVERIEPNSWDVRLDRVVTDTAHYRAPA